MVIAITVVIDMVRVAKGVIYVVIVIIEVVVHGKEVFIRLFEMVIAITVV